MSKTFYDIFLEECDKPNLLVHSYDVTEAQKEVINNDYNNYENNIYGERIAKGFFNQLPKEAYRDVAKKLANGLKSIENDQNGLVKQVVHNSKVRAKDIQVLKNLVTQFDTQNRDEYISPKIIVPLEIKDYEEVTDYYQTKLSEYAKKIDTLIYLSKWLLTEIQNEDDIHYTKDRVIKKNGEHIASRKELKLFLENTAKQYNIKNSTRLIKQLIKDLHPLNN